MSFTHLRFMARVSASSYRRLMASLFDTWFMIDLSVYSIASDLAASRIS